MQLEMSRNLPVRLVSAGSGFFLEWNATWRVRIPETMTLCMSDEQAWMLRRGLQESVWVPPPSMRKVLKIDSVLAAPEYLSLRIIKRAWLQAVRRWLGRDVFRLSLKIRPNNADLPFALRVRAHINTLKAREAEHAGLMPLLGTDPGMWSGLNNWKGIKQRFVVMGLTQLAWRWLTVQPSGYVARIDWCQLSHVAWVNCHAALDRPFPARWVDRQTAAFRGFGVLGLSVRRLADNLRSDPGVQMLKCLRLVLKRLSETEGIRNQEEVISEEFPLIADWLSSTLQSSLSGAHRIRRGWTYDTLLARQAHWHLVELSMNQSHTDVFWPELLGRGQIEGQCDFMELSSLNALLREARTMHHCVPSYIDRCMAGEICLFHLQSKGAPLERATLEISRAGVNQWAITQLKGPCNTPVSNRMHQAARELLACLNPRAKPFMLPDGSDWTPQGLR